MASQMIADRIKVIDTDTHISEPYDLWTSRVSKKWGDLVPYVTRDAETGDDMWVLGGQVDPLQNVGQQAWAGWKEVPMGHPHGQHEADPACFDAQKRLERMDDYGLYTQVIYPNVAGFGSGKFLQLKEPALQLECVRAYNDFLVDWCSADPKRLIGVPAMPFWDIDACVAEMHRCANLGFKSILLSNEPDSFGEPLLADPHWNPLWATAQDLGLAVAFHIAGGDLTGGARRRVYPGNGTQANFAGGIAQMYQSNERALVELIVSGICHRYPRLNFISVESGVGWIPFLLAALEWQWVGAAVRKEHPEYDLLPSEYFKRQIYACFWFEHKTVKAAIDILGPENILYETDFPHPVSMSPGPASQAPKPRDFIEQNLSDLPEPVLQAILHDNAAKLYKLS